jgi:DNA-binding transcriptional MerR regulator
MLLRIGEFARLVGLSVRTVRYYGDVGLLPPNSVDPATGYRRYRIVEIERARRLIALKESGLSLEEIRMVLDDRLTADQFRTLLEAKVVELQTEAARLDEQLKRAQAQLEQLTRRMEHTMPEVTLKQTEQKKIAFIREELSGIEAIPELFERFFSLVDPTDAVGPAGNIYHHFADDGRSIDIEAVIPVADGYQAPDGVSVRLLPSTEVAVLTHRGAFNRLHEAHSEVLSWVAGNGYEVVGPSYEWNLVCEPPVTQDNESYVTDVEVEVAKA